MQARIATIFVFLLSLSSASVAHGRRSSSRRLVMSHGDEPCEKMRLYFHDILYDVSNSTANSTSAVVAKPTALLQATMNASVFGTMMVFDDPMTEGKALPPALEETAVRAQGLYFYDQRRAPSDAWFAFSVVFNSTERRGTLSVMGADIVAEETRDLSVVGGTGDFFMARGVATLRGDAVEGFKYFRLQMDIKLYECYA
ncbi:dirigent protein 5-like [Oryza brachyantha]|uniref:Dirigent protein n=1 Tax=Oryza brachyantha TaxID=4533 RepID=J3MNE0_ORYBR|nr:dirigent protein 5-like [Oryza brachyantha]